MVARWPDCQRVPKVILAWTLQREAYGGYAETVCSQGGCAQGGQLCLRRPHPGSLFLCPGAHPFHETWPWDPNTGFSLLPHSFMWPKEQDPLRLCPHTGLCPQPSHVPSSSQLALLMELSQNRGGDSYRPFAGPQSGPAFNSVFQNENFQLQLAPPPVAED